MEEIVWQIYNEGAVDSRRIGERVVFLEPNTNPVFMLPEIKTLPSPRLIKSHLPYHAIPKSTNEEAQCKYIYIARNPKDVALSYFKFMVSHPVVLTGYNGPWEFYAKLFVEGNGKYFFCLYMLKSNLKRRVFVFASRKKRNSSKTMAVAFDHLFWCPHENKNRAFSGMSTLDGHRQLKVCFNVGIFRNKQTDRQVKILQMNAPVYI